MSQHSFYHDNYEFMVGWDPPLQYFFLVIYMRYNDEEPVFSNLDLSNPAMTISQIKHVCEKYGTVLPPETENRLLNDRKENM
jgi:hypothetical protein